MLYSPDRTSKWFQFTVVASFSAGLILSPLAFAHEEHEKEKLAAAAEKTLTGEIVDLMCYADHGATGNRRQAREVRRHLHQGRRAGSDPERWESVSGGRRPQADERPARGVRGQNDHVEREAREQWRNSDARERRDREEVMEPGAPSRRTARGQAVAISLNQDVRVRSAATSRSIRTLSRAKLILLPSTWFQRTGISFIRRFAFRAK
jgi:hypothetical protein